MNRLATFGTAIAAACIAGCGGLAAAPDAKPDTIDAAATTAGITVLAMDGSGAPVDALVVSVAADGTQIASVRSGAQGKVRIEVRGKTTIHVLSETAMVTQLTTIEGVVADDDILVGKTKDINDVSGASSSMMLQRTETPTLPDRDFSFFSKCGSTGRETDTLETKAPCNNGSGQIVGLHRLSGFIQIPNVNFRNRVLNVTGALSSLLPFTFNITSVPTEVNSMTASRSVMMDGREVVQRSVSISAITPSVSASVSSLPMQVGDQNVIRIRLGIGTTSSSIVARTLTTSSSVAIDAAANPLPFLSSTATVTSSGVAWSSSLPTGVTPQLDARSVVLEGDGTDNRLLRWVMFDSELADSKTFPTLPPALAAFEFATAGSPRATATLVSFQQINGYEAAKANLISLFDPLDNNGFFGSMSFTGRISSTR